MNKDYEKRQGIEKLIRVENGEQHWIDDVELLDLTNLTQINTIEESVF